jgi:hypothetical protein
MSLWLWQASFQLYQSFVIPELARCCSHMHLSNRLAERNRVVHTARLNDSAQTFSTNDIDGRALLKLSSEDLKQLVPTMGQRLRLESHLEVLRGGAEHREGQEEALSLFGCERG